MDINLNQRTYLEPKSIHCNAVEKKRSINVTTNLSTYEL